MNLNHAHIIVTLKSLQKPAYIVVGNVYHRGDNNRQRGYYLSIKTLFTDKVSEQDAKCALLSGNMILIKEANKFGRIQLANNSVRMDTIRDLVIAEIQYSGLSLDKASAEWLACDDTP
tara:strand:- start:749 stop:1102 length:354 start_codon:yes stop_codon:yes gene_type:complete